MEKGQKYGLCPDTDEHMRGDPMTLLDGWKECYSKRTGEVFMFKDTYIFKPLERDGITQKGKYFTDDGGNTYYKDNTVFVRHLEAYEDENYETFPDFAHFRANYEY